MRLAAAKNLLKTWLLVALLAAFCGTVGWAAGGYRGASIFAFCALLAAAAAYAYADRALLGMLGAREYALAEDPILRSTVDALSAKLGIVPPKLYVIADGFPRALVAGRGPRGSSIAVSTGLLGALPPTELEGVLAHELVHVRSRDVLVQTFAVLLAFFLVELARIGGWFRRGLLAILGPIAAAFVHVLLSPKREFVADRAAAELTGSPHGLADALLRLDRASELVSFSESVVTEPLYTVDPFADEGLGALFGTHPPLGERIDRLRRLDPTWQATRHAA
ncbi:MAG: M48 family metalloprotease [Actinobacteria bacterium]|nr:M48 family metalloprotease [Actinomycetota bacterium]